MTDSISARRDAALEGIAAAGREIAAAIWEAFQPVVDAPTPKAPPLFERDEPEVVVPLTSRPDLIDAANETLANFRLQPMTPEEIASAKVRQADADTWRHKAIRRNLGMARLERERDEARAEVERLRAAAPVRPGDDSARLLWDGTYWYAERDVQEARRLREELQARIDTALGILGEHGPEISCAGDTYTQEGCFVAGLAERIRTALDARPKIGAPVPPEQPQGASGGSGSTGTLGERLRAAADYQDRPGAYDELRALAAEVDEVEAAYRVADAEIARLTEFHDHYRGQVEAIRAAIKREAEHGDAITRCNLVAERFQTGLDGVSGEGA